MYDLGCPPCSYQISVHLGMLFQRRRFFFLEINQSETRMACGMLVRPMYLVYLSMTGNPDILAELPTSTRDYFFFSCIFFIEKIMLFLSFDSQNIVKFGLKIKRL